MPKTSTARAPLARVIFDEVRAFCQANANAERARRYARYFTEGYDAYGVDSKSPEWTEHIEGWSKRLRDGGPTAFLDAADLLVATGKYEEASVAFLMAKDLKEFHTAEAFDRLGRWFDLGICNWGHTDVMCGEVLSHFITDGVVDLDRLVPWRESEFKYKRRAVPVMLIKPLKTRTDLIAFVEPMMHDTERVVHQGVGWFLREAWKKTPKPVEALLKKHKQTAPRLIYQYATEKMTPEQRDRFRRTK